MIWGHVNLRWDTHQIRLASTLNILFREEHDSLEHKAIFIWSVSLEEISKHYCKTGSWQSLSVQCTTGVQPNSFEDCSLMQSWLANVKQIKSLQSEPPYLPDLRKVLTRAFSEVKIYTGFSQKQYMAHNHLFVLLRLLLQLAVQEPQRTWQLKYKYTIYWGLGNWLQTDTTNKLWKPVLWKRLLNWAFSSLTNQLLSLVLVGD